MLRSVKKSLGDFWEAIKVDRFRLWLKYKFSQVFLSLLLLTKQQTNKLHNQTLMCRTCVAAHASRLAVQKLTQIFPCYKNAHWLIDTFDYVYDYGKEMPNLTKTISTQPQLR